VVCFIQSIVMLRNCETIETLTRTVVLDFFVSQLLNFVSIKLYVIFLQEKLKITWLLATF